MEVWAATLPLFKILHLSDLTKIAKFPHLIDASALAGAVVKHKQELAFLKHLGQKGVWYF